MLDGTAKPTTGYLNRNRVVRKVGSSSFAFEINSSLIYLIKAYPRSIERGNKIAGSLKIDACVASDAGIIYLELF